MWFRGRAIENWQQHQDTLRRHRYGVIETHYGQVQAIYLRSWPKLVSLPEAVWIGRWRHQHQADDRCLLYYDQPRGHSNFLALKYVQSFRGTRLATFYAALHMLDEIARLKGSDALLCEVTNPAISDRFLRRQGWERHTGSRWHRNYIKRFYGIYPAGLRKPNDRHGCCETHASGFSPECPAVEPSKC